MLIFTAGLVGGGWMAGQAVPQAAAGPSPPAAETTLVQDLDYLGGEPNDSLPHVCQTLVPERDQGAR
ncbi:MAG TPA: hypothetical protein VFA18_15780 [Gemmataceae bacterium]|nr:hypothetical protein [Gemmataceae bacterium]